jgi:Lar family restriction alleviation protein
LADQELKPCPFCGSEELGSFSVDDPESDENYEQVTCDGCDMMGPESLNREQSAAKWNHRHEEDRLRSEIEVLKARVLELENLIGIPMPRGAERLAELREKHGAKR